MALKMLFKPWLPLILLCVIAVPIARSILQLRDATIWNERIKNNQLTGIPESSMPPEALMAHAAALDAQGDFEGALSAYKRIEEQTGNPYAKDAAYNASTIYLKRAIGAGGPAADPQTIPLVELAKEGYRSLLRNDPEDWDARYNLDRALRLLPEEDQDENEGGNPPIGAERAPTTMRGFTLGLP
jgi:mxaK protein